MLPILNREAPKGKMVYSKEVNIFEREGYFPRAFIAHKGIVVSDEEKLLMVLDRLGDQLRYVAVLNHTVPSSINLELRDAPPIDNSSAQIINYTPNEVVIKTSLGHPGFLILGDAYHPDWKAYVDGNPTPVYQTDYLLRSVFLPAGEHKVKFIFVPMWFYWGGLVSLLASIALVIFWNLPKTLTDI